MAEKIKEEVFDTTEINVDEIKLSDESEDWEYLSKFEVEPCIVPYIEVPRMHEIAEHVGRDGQELHRMFSRERQESAKRKEKLQQLSLQGKGNEKVKSAMDKAMQFESFQRESEQDEPRCNKDSETVRREMEEALRIDSLEQDNERIRKERDDALLKISKYVREIERLRRENKVIRGVMEEMRKERIKAKEAARDSSEDERVGREKKETMQDVRNAKPILGEQNRNNGSLTRHGQQPEPIKCCAANSQKKSKNAIHQKESKPNRDNKFTSSAAASSKSKPGVCKRETLAQEKGEIGSVDPEFLEHFLKFFNKNPRVEDKDSTETAKVDKMEKKKDSCVKVCSKHSVLFQKVDNSTDEEEIDKFSDKKNN